MSTFNAAFKLVSDLVKDFKENEKSYLQPNYSEADVRNDFINKFFIALGWDLRHEQQKNPYEQEVRVEKPVQIAKAQKRADYTFYLAPNFRDVKYFVEAKKPYHDLENKDYFFQTIRYGWNANTPIAVLTDFEEFIILDCRYRPDINDILNFKIKRFHYSEYANEDKFKEIYFLFSREAVSDNSLGKYSDSLPKPKGKTVQRGLFAGGFQSIDEAFLEELDEIRNDLAKSFKKNNSHLTSEELTEATQRTIDRLVFIKFLEDKLIEPHHYVSGFGDRRSAWEDFINASLTLDAKYNGVVFKKSLIDSRNIIEPDDKTFSKICEDLSHENTPYNFDAIPIHILGSIYERFLGKVVNATDKRVTIEEKPEVRKAGGVYYTPQYIVNYIVDNTIGKLIEGKTPKEIAKMRFADIACGSGSFLITVYERLLDYHKRWYIKNPDQAKKEGCILYENVYRLSLQQKQKILTNNIFGVDLDHQAVEVTELSLYLKLLEDETTSTANDSWVMFKEQLLPNLNNNIICGNSLIGIDFFDGKLFSREEGLKLKPMDFEEVFPKVMINGGFDAIIGNPPYVSHELEEQERNYYSKKYPESLVGKPNTYRLFINKSILVLKKNGLLGYIIPNTYLSDHDSTRLRELLFNKCSINEILFFPENARVFQNVTQATTILILQNQKLKESKIRIIAPVKNLKNLYDNEVRIYSQSRFEELPEKMIVVDRSDKQITIIESLLKNCSRFEDIAEVFQGEVNVSINKKSIYATRINEKCFPLVRGNNIGRYSTNLSFSDKKGSWIQVPKKGFRNHYLNERIVTQEISNMSQKRRLNGMIIAKDIYVGHTANYLVKKNDTYSYLFLTGLLNSFLLDFIFQTFNNTNHLPAREIKRLPFKEVNFDIPEEKSLYAKIVINVKNMIDAKNLFNNSKTDSEKDYLSKRCSILDKQIDLLVYELYGLTDEEIKTVEEGAKC